MIRLALLCLLFAAGCARISDLPLPGRGVAEREPPPEEIAAVVAAPPPPPGARTAEEFDTTTPEQRAAATNVAPAAEEPLGEAVASLGNPAEAGLWLETSLVDGPRAGRVVAQSGAQALVELRPGDGGARLSLASMQLLGVPLTSLPTITVYGR